MATTHRIFLIPGMFGFGQLAGYDYFGHVERVLGRSLAELGAANTITVVPTPPTASLRRRARRVAKAIATSLRDHPQDPIHVVGHSTGGLDARLLASPGTHLDIPADLLAWRRQLRSVVSINTPHYGTPLAQFFTTVSGTRLLYLLSLLSFTSLKLGDRPLSLLSSLVATASKVDGALGIKVGGLDKATRLVLRFIGQKSQAEVRSWLDGIRQDQGGIVQITPEAMDLYNAATEDSPAVRYGCMVTASAAPAAGRFAATVRSPYAALSAAIYTTVYTFASRPHKHYPYPEPGVAAANMLERAFGCSASDRHNDGIVPTLSMLWGRLLWCGQGDHLDVVGHFADDHRPISHADWLRSGSRFGRRRFRCAMQSLARFLTAPQ